MTLVAMCYMLYGMIRMNVFHPDVEEAVASYFKLVIEKAEQAEKQDKALRDEYQNLEQENNDLREQIHSCQDKIDRYDIHVYAVDKNASRVQIIRVLRKAVPGCRLRLAASLTDVIIKWVRVVQVPISSESYLSIMPWGLPINIARPLVADLQFQGVHAQINKL